MGVSPTVELPNSIYTEKRSREIQYLYHIKIYKIDN